MSARICFRQARVGALRRPDAAGAAVPSGSSFWPASSEGRATRVPRFKQSFETVSAVALALLCATHFTTLPAHSAETNSSRYEMRVVHDPNGIGKFYMGREIAHVVGGHET